MTLYFSQLYISSSHLETDDKHAKDLFYFAGLNMSGGYNKYLLFGLSDIGKGHCVWTIGERRAQQGCTFGERDSGLDYWGRGTRFLGDLNPEAYIV